MIYLDNAATTQMSSSSLKAYRQVAEQYFGNPSSLHDTGSEASQVLESARKTLAGILQVPSKCLYFTGSGSEASFLAVSSLAMAEKAKGNHIITTELEHSSLRQAADWLESHGFEVTRLGSDSYGRIRIGDLEQAIREETILVSIQHVNSEIGVIQNLDAIGALLNGRDIRFHSDLVQSFGKLPLNLQSAGIHSATISGHKIHGPKGIGVAYIDNATDWRPFLPGATQERGFRPGTVDVPAAVAFAVAAEEAETSRQETFEKVRSLRARFISLIEQEMPHLVTIEGPEEEVSPYILGLTLSNMEGQHAMLESNRFGLAMSTGSACQVNEQKPSATMLAVGKSSQEAQRLVRFSFSRFNEMREVDEAFAIFKQVVGKHRATVTL